MEVNRPQSSRRKERPTSSSAPRSRNSRSKSSGIKLERKYSSKNCRESSSKQVSRIKFYKRIKRIGKGSYGVVDLVKGRDSKLYVMKIVQNSGPKKTKGGHIQEALKEVEMLSTLDHPNIVDFKEHFVEGKYLCIVMDYCESGDLKARIKRALARGKFFKEATIMDWFVQMALALHYMHSRHIMHRDIKPQNVFLTQSNKIVKLGDFGVTRELNATLALAQTQVGTPYYMSPELAHNKPYTMKSDVWALGCVLCEMSTLRVPFDAKNFPELAIKIQKNKPRALSKCYSSGLHQLCSWMLEKDVKKRPSIQEVIGSDFVRNHLEDFANRHIKTAKEAGVDFDKNGFATTSLHQIKNNLQIDNRAPSTSEKLLLNMDGSKVEPRTVDLSPADRELLGRRKALKASLYERERRLYKVKEQLSNHKMKIKAQRRLEQQNGGFEGEAIVLGKDPIEKKLESLIRNLKARVAKEAVELYTVNKIIDKVDAKELAKVAQIATKVRKEVALSSSGSNVIRASLSSVDNFDRKISKANGKLKINVSVAVRGSSGGETESETQKRLSNSGKNLLMIVSPRPRSKTKRSGHFRDTGHNDSKKSPTNDVSTSAIRKETQKHSAQRLKSPLQYTATDRPASSNLEMSKRERPVSSSMNRPLTTPSNFLSGVDMEILKKSKQQEKRIQNTTRVPTPLLTPRQFKPVIKPLKRKIPSGGKLKPL